MKHRVTTPGQYLWILLATVLGHCAHARASDPVVEAIALPPLRVHGQMAQAHTQGLELIDGHYYVTARRDDVLPKQALLLRTTPGMTHWDIWDITPANDQQTNAALDHPGGFQSDGKRLWIPLAESRRNGSSVVRVFALADMIEGQSLKAEFEFSVDDHIGALAVDVTHERVLGASWDTESVYVWNMEGELQKSLSHAALRDRSLGVSSKDKSRTGVAVQDWKFVGRQLVASGLFKGPLATTSPSKSRLVALDHVLEDNFRKRTVTLPSLSGVELANEGMVVAGGGVYFIPEDLGATNRLFRMRTAELFPGRP